MDKGEIAYSFFDAINDRFGDQACIDYGFTEEKIVEKYTEVADGCCIDFEKWEEVAKAVTFACVEDWFISHKVSYCDVGMETEVYYDHDEADERVEQLRASGHFPTIDVSSPSWETSLARHNS